MVSGLICSGQLSLAAWEPYVPTRAQQAQSTERRWQRFMGNPRIRVERLYLPLVMVALSGWQQERIYLALDTTMLWNRYCMIHLSVVCCGRAVPLLWRVLEHNRATVAFGEYRRMLRQARWLLRRHPNVMLLADRGFAIQLRWGVALHELMKWLSHSSWHDAVRLPCDVLIQGADRYPRTVGFLYPPVSEACLYRRVRLWADGAHCCNLVLATLPGTKDSWAA